MRDVSFVIPIRVDTPDRLENAATILRFLTQHFPESEVQLIEQDSSTQVASLIRSYPQVLWRFVFNDGHFSRSAALNLGFIGATRPCVCAYDTDILIDPRALRRAAALILAGRWPIVIPFNLIFVELSGDSRKRIIDTVDLAGLSEITRLADVPRQPDIAARVLSGATVMCDRDIVIAEGGYNRKMVSYGWEDIEFFKRFAKLGYYSYILHGFNLIHLDHRRGPDSLINAQYALNKAEFDKVRRMSRKELQAYVAEELQIGPNLEAPMRARLRSRQALRNSLLMRRPAHLANRAWGLFRTGDAGGLAGKLWRR